MLLSWGEGGEEGEVFKGHGGGVRWDLACLNKGAVKMERRVEEEEKSSLRVAVEFATATRREESNRVNP